MARQASVMPRVWTCVVFCVGFGRVSEESDLRWLLVFGDVEGTDSAALEALAYDERGTLFVPDIILVPGGLGVRTEVKGGVVLRWLKKAAKQNKPRVIFSVCTGSWLLAAAGALNGRRATSNKRAMAQGHPQTAGPAVFWQPRARWVFDADEAGRLFLTSSGVAAAVTRRWRSSRGSRETWRRSASRRRRSGRGIATRTRTRSRLSKYSGFS